MRSLSVDGRRAKRRRAGAELVVTPRHGIAAGEDFTVVVRYRGRPRAMTNADGTREGWVRTDDGAFVAGEPRGSETWFPSNDHPTDKASFSFRVNAPRRTATIANGRLRKRIKRRGRTTWVWREAEPMAPYLATVTSGHFHLERSRFGEIRVLTALDPTHRRAAKPTLRRLPEILDLFESLFGPYPFSDAGAIVDDARSLGYSLETQTRPIFHRAPSEVLLAHELAHQWFGDSVSLERWPDIWLNEGFATWAAWRWSEERGGPSTAARLAELYETPASDKKFWTPPPGAPPGPRKLFDGTIYVRGGMALEVLRQAVGEADFEAILREWARRNAYANASTADFIALSEEISGDTSLSADVFEPWLFESGKPPPP